MMASYRRNDACHTSSSVAAGPDGEYRWYKMDTKEMNLLGIVAFVGAILMVVGVFLAWLTVNLGLGETSTSGWNVYTESSGSLKYTFAPLVCLICGIL